MRRNSGPFYRNSGAYTSPGTPEYGDYNVRELPKTWSSERVPLPMGSRRHVSSAALMPFNSGRTLPSKWDDAERWITSPISGFGGFKNSVAQTQKRAMSKSGPLRPTGNVYLPGYSPAMPVNEGGNVRNFMANSPLTTGVLIPEGLTVHYEDQVGGKSSSLYDDSHMIISSTSVPGFSDMLSEISVPSSQDDKLDGAKEKEGVVSRRDMATQMSPKGSTHSSSKGKIPFSALPSSFPTSFLHRNLGGKDDVRDVQVDKGTTTARHPKTQCLREMGSTNLKDLPSAWNVTEASKDISKLQREEAKISAWENLQKAKAEAAIRKLEMKLEKKRSASMDKITNKLRAAQIKAEAMRKAQSEQASRPSHKGISHRVYLRICSICSCSLCRNT